MASAVSPHDPALVASYVRRVGKMGTDWWEALKADAFDNAGAGDPVIVSFSSADGGAQSGQLAMDPQQFLVLAENVDRRLAGQSDLARSQQLKFSGITYGD